MRVTTPLLSADDLPTASRISPINYALFQLYFLQSQLKDFSSSSIEKYTYTFPIWVKVNNFPFVFTDLAPRSHQLTVFLQLDLAGWSVASNTEDHFLLLGTFSSFAEIPPYLQLSSYLSGAHSTLNSYYIPLSLRVVSSQNRSSLAIFALYVPKSIFPRWRNKNKN